MIPKFVSIKPSMYSGSRPVAWLMGRGGLARAQQGRTEQVGGFDTLHSLAGQFSLFQAESAQRPVGLSSDLALFDPIGNAVAD